MNKYQSDYLNLEELLMSYAIGYIKNFGEVLTEHIGSEELTDQGENLPEKEVFARDTSWIKKADVVIAEVSSPSLGVGYEICLAETLKKRILCLYKKQEGKKLSTMLVGNPNLKIVHYSDLEEANAAIKDFLTKHF
ncbi:MAG TPA: nucleoside 2-deoxyribosyltransferase [Patescibacteria group bacterium]|nr:nucleoside 2-deoxyribosyltransferase [Patescibacteria group bacterium]